MMLTSGPRGPVSTRLWTWGSEVGALFKVELSDGRSLTAPTKNDAVKLGALDGEPGKLFAVESPRGKVFFYKRGLGGSVAYPLSAKAASWLAMTS